jgi:hypothetical protein
MTTFLEDRRLGGAATGILGHKMPNLPGDERAWLAKVTEQHYNSSQGIGLKAEGMQLWVKALLPPTHGNAASWQVAFPMTLPRRSGDEQVCQPEDC